MKHGFIVSDFSRKFPVASNQLAFWLKEGELTYAETIAKGFDYIPQSFLDLIEEINEGKIQVYL